MENKNSQIVFEAIGTKWTIDIDISSSTFSLSEIKEAIDDSIERFDSLYSRFREDSLITQISKDKGEYAFPKDGLKMLELYQKLYKISNGAVTPLIGNLLSQAGYDASYSLTPRTLSKVKSWEEALSLSKDHLTLREPVLLDFGALGKGQLIDEIGEILEKKGIYSYCIDGSGDILYKSSTSHKLRVGLEHPEDNSKVIGVSEISDGSICASSGNRRKWDKFNHIMDPHALRSVTSVLATWVIAATALEADALATALFFVSPQDLKNDFSFEYVTLYPDYSFKKSAAFPGELYYNKNSS